MTRIISFSVGLLFVLGSASSIAEGYWNVYGPTASITMTHPEAKKKDFVTVLVIRFVPDRECDTEIGVSMLTGAELGAPQRQQLAKRQMKVTIDGKSSWSDRTGVTQYSNGFEYAFIATGDLLAAIEAGDDLVAQLYPEGPSFGFPIAGAGDAFDQARLNCELN